MDVSEKPDALIIDCFESDVRAFIGPNADYYVNRWKRAGNVYKISGINLACVLIGPFWMIYRKMYWPALGILAASILLPLIFTEPIVKMAFTAVSIGVSGLVNGWYYNMMKNKVGRINLSDKSVEERHAAMKKAGSPNLVMAIVAFVLFLLIIFVSALASMES